jgi:hypothetical protein
LLTNSPFSVTASEPNLFQSLFELATPPSRPLFDFVYSWAQSLKFLSPVSASAVVQLLAFMPMSSSL